MEWSTFYRVLPWRWYPYSLREAQQLTPIGLVFAFLSLLCTMSAAARPLSLSTLGVALLAALCAGGSALLPIYWPVSRKMMNLFVGETRHLFRLLSFRVNLSEISFIDTDRPLPPMDKMRELEERLESLQRRKRVSLREVLNFADEIKDFTRPFLGPQSS